MILTQNTCKRRDFPTTKHRLYAIILTVFSIALLLVFVLGEYQTAARQKGAELKLSDKLFSEEIVQGVGNSPLGLTVVSLWALSCLVFFRIFRKHLKSLFQLYLAISLSVLILFNFWSFFIFYALTSPNQDIVAIASAQEYSLVLKTLLLLFWSLFSLFLGFVSVNGKYMGIFQRLNAQCVSVIQGSWNTVFFFRPEDPFAFLADNLNALKKLHLSRISAQEETLLAVKKQLSESVFSTGVRDEALRILKTRGSQTSAA